ncbi:MAG: hypothetical protein WDN02_10980 [Methylovirgula sp.]|uniref:hypothetical protein n=1 Tax=Methylovirgula sp. TaxID=1978224 RepID=UPI003076641A
MRTPLPIARCFAAVKCACLPAFLILSACSSGPSSDDIKSAMQNGMNQLLGPMAPTYNDISDVDCKEAVGEPGYVCSFTQKLTMKNGLPATQVLQKRFIQQGSNWVVM